MFRVIWILSLVELGIKSHKQRRELWVVQVQG